MLQCIVISSNKIAIMVAIQVLIVLLALNNVLGRPNKVFYDLENAAEYFENFIKEYNKQYADENEREEKFEIFKMKLAEINRLNEENPDIVYGITIFTDMTSEDFQKTFISYEIPARRQGDECEVYTDDAFLTGTAPPSFDWRQQGKVTPVKNQLFCGSCWAFASTGAVESQYAIKHGELISLSEQQLVDCVPFTSCKDGGYPEGAFSTLIYQEGQMLEQDYPYESRREECRYNHTKAFAVVNNCSVYQLESVQAIKKVLVQKGPLVVGVHGYDANLFEHFKFGTVDLCHFGSKEKAPNHAALLVGYGVEEGVPYWILKNSWGSKWGIDGYFRMKIHEASPCHDGLLAIVGVEVA